MNATMGSSCVRACSLWLTLIRRRKHQDRPSFPVIFAPSWVSLILTLLIDSYNPSFATIEKPTRKGTVIVVNVIWCCSKVLSKYWIDGCNAHMINAFMADDACMDGCHQRRSIDDISQSDFHDHDDNGPMARTITHSSIDHPPHYDPADSRSLHTYMRSRTRISNGVTRLSFVALWRKKTLLRPKEPINIISQCKRFSSCPIEWVGKWHSWLPVGRYDNDDVCAFAIDVH